MSKKNSQQIKYLTVSAMLCALGVVILGLGSLIEVLDLTVSVIASLLTVYAVIEIGGVYPWLIWIVTSVIALLLLPLKTPVLFYALLTGYYPIIKQKIERRMARLPAWALKMGVLAVSLGIIWGVMRLFLPDLLESSGGWIMIATTVGLAVLSFVLYDICLTKLITLYFVRLQKRFRIK
ncbi:MAG: hypothetical protein E7584_04050 [Ruminococcaceae bacterium]|nr:hypothetical protein [Oscillospiraceae bacterium]